MINPHNSGVDEVAAQVRRFYVPSEKSLFDG
jgi:hypothetical protein